MDLIKKVQNIISEKIEIQTNKPESAKCFIVYFLHENDIVYIGKTLNILEYVEERKDKYLSTHYSYEEVLVGLADNYLAEIILNIQPIYNGNLPKNTKYISSNQSKNKYFISKTEFKKVFKEFGSIQYKTLVYIEKEIFDDIYAKEPYHENIPKIGNRINLKSDYIQAPLNEMGGTTRETLYDEEGNPVEAIRDYIPDYKQEYQYLCFLEDNEYEVSNLIDSITFEAVKIIDGTKIILNAKNKSNSWNNENMEGLWIGCIHHYSAENIRRKYLELMKVKD